MVAILPVEPLRKLEDLMNWLTDMDWAWWPLLSVRPPRTKDIDNRVLLKITAFFGSAAGLTVVALHFLKTGTASPREAAICLGYAWTNGPGKRPPGW